MRALIVDKKKVVSAYIEVHDELSGGSGTNSGSINLYSGQEADRYHLLLRVSFQRNVLDRAMPLSDYRRYDNLTSLRDEMPAHELDFGQFPYGNFYSPWVDFQREVNADLGGAKVLVRAAKIIEKIEDAMQVFNIRHTTKDEMKMWIDALSKFGVELNWRFNVGRTRYTSKMDIPDRYQSPAHQYLAKREGELKAAAKPTEQAAE